MKNKTHEFGVVVDEKGHYVAALRWEIGTPRPKINAKNAPKMCMLLSEDAINGAAPKGKWNFKDKRWNFPTETKYKVNSRGQLIGSGAYWPDKTPPLNPGEEYVVSTPPKRMGRKPIWNGTEWVFPKRVAIVDLKTGETLNTVLECPRSDTDNAQAPSGCKCVYLDEAIQKEPTKGTTEREVDK